MTDRRTDGQTDGRTDGGDCNIPDAFLKKRGDKNMYQKYISQLKCSRISFLKLFLVPYMYTFTDCNLRVGKFDVSASNMIMFWRQYYTKLRLMDSGNA